MSVGWIHTVTDAVSTLCPHPLESPYFHAHQPTSSSQHLCQKAELRLLEPTHFALTHKGLEMGMGINAPTPPLIGQDNSEVSVILFPRASLQE